MKIFAFLKKLLFWRKKSIKEEQAIIVEQQAISEPKIIPEIKQEHKIREIKESKFKRDLQYLKENKDKIIKEKKENELRVVPSDSPNLCYIRFKNKLFSFDKEGFDLLQEEFNQEPYELIIKKEKTKNGGEAFYLARENKNTGKIDFFHRWIMRKEIEDFCLEYNCKQEEVVVHHKNFNPIFNEKDNLQVITITEHNKIHNRI
jgi:hypothetical protein